MRIAFTFSLKLSTQMRIMQNNSRLSCNARLLNFTEKLKTASGKYLYGVNMVTWSFLPFAVNVILNFSNFLASKSKLIGVCPCIFPRDVSKCLLHVFL